jgi:metal-dependent hydrolase (beta-lactamase superfamily II)
LEGHYDNVVLEPIAEAACKKYNTKVVTIGGVHIDNASKEEINKIVENCRGLVECI